ncbi:hypothetical protein LZ318_09885 [Saccharopolyspora indica]|uniref:hypothetical protein n=1 Tax=Saccharopolyspora indica TaxID=1229659 RepID=UPI0022EAAFF2|nr:hypothetical protein [Saccharopolyspora indica]MDA3643333.1 hypothetical protein [Saccharopolyspora indica]
MASFGEILPGRKLKHEGDETGISQGHDPGGPLDLERGVVYLAPPAQADSGERDDTGSERRD